MTGPMNVVTASVRAWTEPAPPARRPRATATNKRKADRSGWGPLRDLLVLDCETTTDPTQALTFGVWRHCTADRDGQTDRGAAPARPARPDRGQDRSPPCWRTITKKKHSA